MAAPQLVSCVSKTVKSVPENYVYPPGLRSEMDATICHDIPVVDLSLPMASDDDDVHGRPNEVAQQLLRALEGGSGFQIINHGVSEKLMADAMEVYREFFKLPIEDKEELVKEWYNTRTSGLYSGNIDPEAKILSWVDTLVHRCYPLEQHIDSWPQKPATYRKVIAEYAIETRKLIQRIFELIAKGLGIEKQHFDGKFIQMQHMRGNYYPKSPDPSLTMGLVAHYDPNTITLIQQNVSGLHVHIAGKWMIVEPLPNAFFVVPGIEFQIISNGMFKALLHQVGSNADIERLSIGIFMSITQTQPTIEPDQAFISDETPQKYQHYSFEKYSKILQTKLSVDRGTKSLVEHCKSSLDFFLI